jgi:hypothetical protein
MGLAYCAAVLVMVGGSLAALMARYRSVQP